MPIGFAIVWGGDRAKGTGTDRNFLLLVDTSQNGFNYTTVTTGRISSVTWANKKMTITFSSESFWQINALYASSSDNIGVL